MINHFKLLLNPACYHGEKSTHHFEGWYFKIVDQKEQNVFAIIPGIFKHKNNHDSHSFIQILDGFSNKALYLQYPVQDFQAVNGEFDIHIQDSYFSAGKILLNIEKHNLKITAELFFNQTTPWPRTLISPGIMGWYTWVPFMECYHDLVSLNHEILGSLTINERKVDFSNGRGYIEKDWGKSFPRAWVWLQSNHFSSAETSITASIAIIPWIGKPFLGFIIGLWHQKRLYRFTTYLGSKLTCFEIDQARVRLILQQKNYVIEISAARSGGGFLLAPGNEGMHRRIIESLNSNLEIELSELTTAGRKVIFQDVGRHAGMEISGDTRRLIAMYEKQK